MSEKWAVRVLVDNICEQFACFLITAGSPCTRGYPPQLQLFFVLQFWTVSWFKENNLSEMYFNNEFQLNIQAHYVKELNKGALALNGNIIINVYK